MSVPVARIIIRQAPEPPPLSTWRCPSCGTILAKLTLSPRSVVEIKCRRCNAVATKEVA